MMTGSNGILKFSSTTWLALAAMAIAPASGFAIWASTLSTNVALLQDVSSRNVQAIDKLAENNTILIRLQANSEILSEAVKTNKERLDRIEDRVVPAPTLAPKPKGEK